MNLIRYTDRLNGRDKNRILFSLVCYLLCTKCIVYVFLSVNIYVVFCIVLYFLYFISGRLLICYHLL